MNTFKALDLLVATAPKVKGRAPYWRAPVAGIDRTALVEPSWSWARPWVAHERGPVVVLDGIAAYMAAASSVEVAHGPLRHVTRRGQLVPVRIAAGYWSVELPAWNHREMPPPWGSRPLPVGPMWISAPTMRLLIDLAADSHCALPVVHEAWLGETRCRLRPWVQKVAAAREEALRAGDAARYLAVKEGYSMAVTMMGTGKGTVVYRPDWGDAIRAQHAANLWWRGWRATRRELYPLGLLEVDELVMTRADATRILLWNDQDHEHGVAPFLIDRHGHRLGAFHPKAHLTADQWETIAAKHLQEVTAR